MRYLLLAALLLCAGLVLANLDGIVASLRELGEPEWEKPDLEQVPLPASNSQQPPADLFWLLPREPDNKTLNEELLKKFSNKTLNEELLKKFSEGRP
jgi:hypothetical protein